MPAVLGCVGWVCIHEFFSRGQKVILLSIANAPRESSVINYCDVFNYLNCINTVLFFLLQILKLRTFKFNFHTLLDYS